MRICLVSTELAGFRGGGIGTYVAEAGKALTAAGHEVWLLTAAPGAELSKERGNALRQHPDFAKVLFAGDGLSEDQRKLRFSYASAAYRHSWLVHETLMACQQSFDYIEFPDYNAEGYVPLQEQRLFGSYGETVVALTLHSPTREIYKFNQQSHLIGPSLRQVCVLEDEAIAQAPLLNCPSERLLAMVGERLELADPGEIIRYPMSLPADIPTDLPNATRLQDLRFLYFGRIEPRKGVAALIEAFRRMPALSIELIGRDGTYSRYGDSYVESLRGTLPDNVRITPPIERAQMLRRLSASDVCILPSTWENWPNTAMEAMAAGRIVIGGRNGGMAEMIEHGTSGLLVDGGDPADIVRVVNEDLKAVLPRLADIGKAAASKIRELCDPSHYVQAIEERIASARAARSPRVTANTEGKLVSIITPYYREDAKILGAAVDSALAQTHEHFELILVDDGSPRADAEQILETIENRDSRIRVLHKPNGGLASARNHAIDAATGEFLLFLDADNVLDPCYAETGLQVFTRHPDAAAIAVSCRHFRSEPGDTPGMFNPLPYDDSLAIYRNAFGDAGAMFRAATFREHGLRYDSLVDLYSDWALWLDCARAGLRVEPISRCLFHYRVHAQSSSAAQSWNHHLPLLGLLIERHMPELDDRACRELLTTLTQGWGVGSLLASLSHSPLFEEQPLRMARAIHGNGLTFRVLNFLAKRGERWPLLAKIGRGLASSILSLHGRLK